MMAAVEWRDPEAYLGTIVAGKYVIDRLIGAGGFAWVYHAKMVTKRHVAIKVLHARSEIARRRFEREIEVLKALPSNTYVAEYIDDGLTIDGRPFIALDFIDGITLLYGMHKCEHLAPRSAVAFVAELCKAFTELHRLGVAHRDVKPENILIDRDGGIKLIDFGLIRDAQGILKLLEQDDPVDRRVFSQDLDYRTLVGTPEYMAPEQFSDAIVDDVASIRTDTWSDVFSLGVILYEMIAGRVPFPMENFSLDEEIEQEIYRYMAERIKLSDVDIPRCPGVDEGLDSILRKALRHDPRQRQPVARVLRKELVRYLSTGKGVSRSYASRTLAIRLEPEDSTELAAALDEASEMRSIQDQLPPGYYTPIPMYKEQPRNTEPGDAEDSRDTLLTPEAADKAMLDSAARVIDGAAQATDDSRASNHSPARSSDGKWIAAQTIDESENALRDTLWDFSEQDPTGEHHRSRSPTRPDDVKGAEPKEPSDNDGFDRVVKSAFATLCDSDTVSAEITRPFELGSADLIEEEPRDR